MIELLRYQRDDGAEPFSDWLNGLRDLRAQARVRVRLQHLGLGNFGDCEPVGDSVLELRIHVGAGYRVYLCRHGKSVVLLLAGGDKASQKRDIKQAEAFWADWKRRQVI